MPVFTASLSLPHSLPSSYLYYSLTLPSLPYHSFLIIASPLPSLSLLCCFSILYFPFHLAPSTFVNLPASPYNILNFLPLTFYLSLLVHPFSSLTLFDLSFPFFNLHLLLLPFLPFNSPFFTISTYFVYSSCLLLLPFPLPLLIFISPSSRQTEGR